MTTLKLNTLLPIVAVDGKVWHLNLQESIYFDSRGLPIVVTHKHNDTVFTTANLAHSPEKEWFDTFIKEWGNEIYISTDPFSLSLWTDDGNHTVGEIAWYRNDEKAIIEEEARIFPDPE